jgi:hypothetical protein
MANEPGLADHRRTIPRVARANRNQAKAGRSWVYFAQAGDAGPIKIGQTRDVHTRIRALRAMHYEEIRLIGVIPETFIPESRLHNEFGPHRIRGEWFRPAPEILAVAAAGDAVFGAGFVHTIPDELRAEYAVLMPISL